MQKPNQLQLYLRLLGYITPYKLVIALTIFALLVSAAMEPATAYVFKLLVDESLISQEASYFIYIPLLLAGIFVIKGIAEYISKVSSQWLSQKSILKIRSQMYHKIQFLAFPKFQELGLGNLISKINYDVAQVSDALSKAWIILIRDSLIVIALLIYLFYISWQLSLLFFIIAPLVAWLTHLASKSIHKASSKIQTNMGDLTQKLEEGISGYRDIKIYSAEEFEQNRFKLTSKELLKQTLKAVRVSALLSPTIQVIAAIALAVIIYFAIQLTQQGKLTPGDLLSFVAAVGLIFEPIKNLTKINLVLQKGLAAAESIFTLLDMPEEENTGTKKPQIKGHIEFKNLTFNYPATPSLHRSSSRPALKNISLIIEAKQVTALVGQSGSGKTTLANLIARFLIEKSTPPYLQEEGIFLDEIPLQEIELEHLRKNLAYVSQNIVLFNASIRDNIAYGQADATEDEIIQAAKNAFAWKFIEKLPQGLDTNIGEKGSLLSGGQRQRIALARAFLKDAPILILDEATSALDNESEAKVQLAMQELCKNRTVIIIAHRLSTIENADKIVVMQKGQILEQGKHQELIENNGYYSQLYQQTYSSTAS